MASSPHNHHCLPSDSFVAPSTPCSSSIDATSRPRSGHSDPRPHVARLRLRNAGFRAPLLPARRVSPMNGNSAPETFVSPLSANDENASFSNEKRRRRNTSISSGLLKASGVFKELTNSSRGRGVFRPPLANVFQEPLDSIPQHEENPSHSILDNQENAATAQMATSFYTNLAKSARLRKKPRTSARSASLEAQRYIEHLESELTATTTKLDTLKSPETVTAQAAKIRGLNKQIQTLDQDLMDWQQRFEERVNDEIFNRTQGDGDLRAQLKILAETLAGKDAHISELERDLEDTRAKLSDSESTEKSLCRRIDVLTELLAKSPTKLSFSASSTPCIANAPDSLSFSQPVFPRQPTSPTLSKRYTTSFDELFRRDQHAVSTSVSNIFQPASPDKAKKHHTGDQEADPSHCASASNARNSCISRPSLSRPTSVISTGSVGIPWGFPITDDETRSASKPKKSRRFATGSTTLKPLILPTTALIPTSVPASAPVRASYETPCRRSMDAAADSSGIKIPGLSNSQSSSTPCRPASRRPMSWNQNLSVSSRAELRRSQTEDAFHGGAAEEDVCASPSSEGFGFENHLLSAHVADDEAIAPLSAVNLNQELEMAFRSGGGDGFLDSSPEDVASQASKERTTEQRIQCEDVNATLRAKHRPTGPSPSDSYDSLSSILDQSTPKPARRMPLERGDHERVSSVPTCPPIVSSLGVPHLTSLVSCLRYRPYMLVRRILLNSWMRCSSNAGGFGRWLLQLIASPRKCEMREVPDFGNSSGRSRKPDRFEKSRVENKFSKISGFPSQSGPVMPVHGSMQLYPRSPGKQEYVSDNYLTETHGQRPLSHAHPSFQRPRLARCPNCVEPAGRRGLTLWAKFSLALVLAIGVAILEGPETLLGEAANFDNPPNPPNLKTNQHNDASERARREASEDTVCYLPQLANMQGTALQR